MIYHYQGIPSIMSTYSSSIDINGRVDRVESPPPRKNPLVCLFISCCLCPAMFGFGPLLIFGIASLTSAQDRYHKDHRDLEHQQAIIAQCPQSLNLPEVICQDLAQIVIANPPDVVFICGRYCPPMDMALRCSSMFRGFRAITLKDQSAYPGYFSGLMILAVGLPLSCLICVIACYLKKKGWD